MKQVFGWWHLDSEALALINAVSGERIRFRDRRLIEQPEEVQGSIRLDYEYSDLRYPLVVESLPRTVEYGLPGTSGPVSSRNWRLDHVRSAETWRREQNQDAAHPPYGVWRRVDDCATDGLACWPEIRPLGGQSRCPRRLVEWPLDQRTAPAHRVRGSILLPIVST
jgi:hypothetical protein